MLIFNIKKRGKVFDFVDFAFLHKETAGSVFHRTGRFAFYLFIL